MGQMKVLIMTILRIGLIGFGGGSALIPVIEKEAVQKKGLLSEAEYDKSVIAASITPGALPVEVASGLGYSIAGERGMAAAAVSMALPGAVLTVLLLVLFSALGSRVLSKLEFISAIISAFIICLLAQYIRRTLLEWIKSKKAVPGLAVILAVFLLNGGKEIAEVLGIQRTPLFDLSSIQIMGLVFFAIFFLAEKRTPIRVSAAAGLGVLFLLCGGKARIIDSRACRTAVEAAMLFLGAWGFFSSLKAGKARFHMDRRKVGRSLGVWLLFLLVLAAPACVFCRGAIRFLFRGLVSSYLSFGGGDAYLSVADGMFVGSGMLKRELFYGQLVSVANLLPGSILCKVLSGAGYLIGYKSSGSILCGLLMALAGFGASVFGSCSIFIVCWHMYSELENVKAFQMTGRYIRLVVSGLLLNIALSLLSEMARIGRDIGIADGWNGIFILVLLCVMAVLDRLISRKA